MKRDQLFPTSLCGVLVFDSVSRTPRPAASASASLNLVTHHLSHTTLSHTIFQTPFFTHHLSHTTWSHTIFHTQLGHTPSFTHNLVTHHLSHTTWSHTIFHTQLGHTPSFTHNFVTHHLSHTPLSHNYRFVWQVWHLCNWAGSGGALGAPWSRGDAAALCVAGVALGDNYRRFS